MTSSPKTVYEDITLGANLPHVGAQNGNAFISSVALSQSPGMTLDLLTEHDVIGMSSPTSSQRRNVHEHSGLPSAAVNYAREQNRRFHATDNQTAAEETRRFNAQRDWMIVKHADGADHLERVALTQQEGRQTVTDSLGRPLGQSLSSPIDDDLYSISPDTHIRYQRWASASGHRPNISRPFSGINSQGEGSQSLSQLEKVPVPVAHQPLSESHTGNGGGRHQASQSAVTFGTRTFEGVTIHQSNKPRNDGLGGKGKEKASESNAPFSQQNPNQAIEHRSYDGQEDAAPWQKKNTGLAVMHCYSGSTSAVKSKDVGNRPAGSLKKKSSLSIIPTPSTGRKSALKIKFDPGTNFTPKAKQRVKINPGDKHPKLKMTPVVAPSAFGKSSISSRNEPGTGPNTGQQVHHTASPSRSTSRDRAIGIGGRPLSGNTTQSGSGHLLSVDQISARSEGEASDAGGGGIPISVNTRNPEHIRSVAERYTQEHYHKGGLDVEHPHRVRRKPRSFTRSFNPQRQRYRPAASGGQPGKNAPVTSAETPNQGSPVETENVIFPSLSGGPSPQKASGEPGASDLDSPPRSRARKGAFRRGVQSVQSPRSPPSDTGTLFTVSRSGRSLLRQPSGEPNLSDADSPPPTRRRPDLFPRTPPRDSRVDQERDLGSSQYHSSDGSSSDSGPGSHRGAERSRGRRKTQRSQRSADGSPGVSTVPMADTAEEGSSSLAIGLDYIAEQAAISNSMSTSLVMDGSSLDQRRLRSSSPALARYEGLFRSNSPYRGIEGDGHDEWVYNIPVRRYSLPRYMSRPGPGPSSDYDARRLKNEEVGEGTWTGSFSPEDAVHAVRFSRFEQRSERLPTLPQPSLTPTPTRRTRHRRAQAFSMSEYDRRVMMDEPAMSLPPRRRLMVTNPDVVVPEQGVWEDLSDTETESTAASSDVQEASQAVLESPGLSVNSIGPAESWREGHGAQFGSGQGVGPTGPNTRSSFRAGRSGFDEEQIENTDPTRRSTSSNYAARRGEFKVERIKKVGPVPAEMIPTAQFESGVATRFREHVRAMLGSGPRVLSDIQDESPPKYDTMAQTPGSGREGLREIRRLRRLREAGLMSLHDGGTRQEEGSGSAVPDVSGTSRLSFSDFAADFGLCAPDAARNGNERNEGQYGS